ncbi:MAG: lysylphosphatidylglycerol synthase transmembrane domain-containing protein [bacterium]
MLVVICVFGIMGFFTMGNRTWEAISQMRIRYIFLACALGVSSISIEGMILQILSRTASDTKVNFFYSVKSILCFIFLSAITPTVTGGEPLMIYMLNQKGITVGKATSITIIRGLVIVATLAIAAPIIIYFHGDIIQYSILKNLFRYIAILLFLVVSFFVYSFFNPLKGEELVHKVCFWMENHKILNRYFKKLDKRLKTWIEDLGSTLKCFFKYKKKTLVGVIILSCISASSSYLIAYAILKGLNFDVPILRILMIQVVLHFLLYFTPTPGGTGIAEAGFCAMFASSLPTHLLGIFVILLRFFTTYIWVIVGGGLITRTIGLDLLDKISSSQG